MNATLAPPPEPPVRSLDDARLTALLRGARTRLGLARLAQTLLLGTPAVAAALGALAWLMGRAEPAVVGAGIVALVVAALVAWFGTPGTGRLAALLDDRLRLADRVGTALQVGARTDAIAVLIRHDAVAHVTPADLEIAFPLRVHRGTWLACAAAAVSAGLWLVERPTRENETARSPSGGAVTVQTSAGAGAGAAGRGAAPTTPESSRTPGQTSRPAGTDALAPPATRAAESAEGSPDGGERVDAARTKAQEGRTALGRGAGAGDSTSPRSREAGMGDGAPGRGTAAGEARGVRGAAARGAAGTAATIGGGAAGGVQYGQKLDGPAAAPPDTAGPAPSAAAIRQARLRAETAIAHDDVPPRYRAYLRDYFRTVQSTSEP